MRVVIIVILLVVVVLGLFAVTRHSRRCADLADLRAVEGAQAQQAYDRECT